ncbi:hypothetical protein GCM10010112_24060 [Actinoplanes lobatus]|uniref:Fido domain-containing protein n=1 Tax=Actinoplanes lobatus TaxID=113568 RepID=A0A7W7HJ20_9ACTN|nr:hypothetical protein [Actinoplanes lobatus]MBB4751448.1 hypothetical protein [Actinoplanes lobatus]GGN64119.1 hypothetical protein GCM10010112_24060 [Actinoplanes lobatus]GIE41057.1 hypothetical protein Alo02nite_39550 [Actinoplanes lobatus]
MTPDHLAVWRRVREEVAWRDVVPHPVTPSPALHDGFAHFARESPRLLASYADVRREAAAGAALTTDLTARWNGIGRGVAVARFRRGPAFAKNGRERYGLSVGTQRDFATCLAQSADRGVPVTARAARAYLDVAFFHPYDDGNARLAGMVLHFLLLRDGIELDEVAPILRTVRRADDAEGAAGLARMVHGIAAATGRRWRRAHP